MITLTSLDATETFIKENQLCFLYISKINCSVCHALLPQVENMLMEFPQIQMGHIIADDVEEVAGRFSIFTAPVLLLFVDGKEMIREARFVHMKQLREKIDKIYRMVVDD